MTIEMDKKDLQYAMKFIVAGYYIDILSKLSNESSEKKILGVLNITEKDIDILKLYADGMQADEISKKMKMTKVSVNETIDEIFSKLGNKEKTKAANFVLNNNVFAI